MRLGWLAIALVAFWSAAAVARPTWDQGVLSHVESASAVPQGVLPDGAPSPYRVRLDQPTARYAHDILGGVPHWTRLEVEALSCSRCRPRRTLLRAVLPDDMIFEDVMPRLWDVTGDGRAEIVVVETSLTKGARLAVWGVGGDEPRLIRIAATPFIGRAQRWLAPVGVGDFDGDGRIEIAYVDRPHLLRELVILRLDGKTLREVARGTGFTAHRIGETVITSAIRSCSEGQVEILLPDGAWSQLMAVQLVKGSLQARALGPMSSSLLQDESTKTCK